MAETTLSEHFNQDFELIYANSPALKKEGFKIRHAVYAEELAWEKTQSNSLETDKYDAYSFSLLLRHKRTGIYAGTIRLILPPSNLLGKEGISLPCEEHYSISLFEKAGTADKQPKGAYGEVSRLAIPEQFRKRFCEKENSGAQGKEPVEINASMEARCHFPSIAIGLYLGVIAFSKIYNYASLFVVIEPRLKKRLERFGLIFEQIGDEIEHHGMRALFCLSRASFESECSADVLELFYSIEQKLIKQVDSVP
ncbi:MAG: GNAT family N-acetyltransferase [Gammaproteobacteria bacterium]|nr:MAG: GNAT family N-acetyltransferase [Gammaproteobacteria bacterium]